MSDSISIGTNKAIGEKVPLLSAFLARQLLLLAASILQIALRVFVPSLNCLLSPSITPMEVKMIITHFNTSFMMGDK